MPEQNFVGNTWQTRAWRGG